MSTLTGLPTAEELSSIMPPKERLEKGPVAVFECLQKIPCNPCADACPRGAIRPFSDINECPTLDDSRCNGCGVCLTRCPGLSIFIMDYSYALEEAMVKIPFEFSPLPVAGEEVAALNRLGEQVCRARVIKVQPSPNKTAVVWLAVPKYLAIEVRNIALGKGADI